MGFVLLVLPVQARAADVPATSPSEAQLGVIDQVVWGSLVGAFVVVLVGSAIAIKVFKFDDKLGPLDWSFSDSWASTLTVIGALLGTILAAGVLPEQTTGIPTTSLAGLDLFFGAVVVIAPVIYAAGCKAVQVTNKDGETTQQQGYVWAFLLASIGTLWGGFGQIATTFYLFGQMKDAGFMSTLTIGLFRSMLMVGLLAMIVYALRGVVWAIRMPTTFTRALVTAGRPLPKLHAL